MASTNNYKLRWFRNFFTKVL